MQAVVLAAGEGTRMRPLTMSRPKALLAVAGTPILTRCFDRLERVGIDEYIVVVGYRGDQIIDAYGESFHGVPIRYVRQSERKGVAHALLSAESVIEDDFVMVNGDNVFNANLIDAVDRHNATAADATLLVESVAYGTAMETGVFVLGEDDEPIGMVEKPDDPPSTLSGTGIFVFSPVIFHACHLVTPSSRGEYELPDAIDLLLHAGRSVETVPLEGWRANLNTPGDIEAVERRLEE